MSLKFKVAVGPLSKEIVEAVFASSDRRKDQIALIASMNQVDYTQGYTGWSTYRFMEFVNALRLIYPDANVVICRDHCGPGFVSGGKDELYETIRVDCEQGFDLIHIDFSKSSKTREQKTTDAIEAIQHARRLRDDIKFEIGTDEITDELIEYGQLQSDILQFKRWCDPEFYVINTGSRTMENRQIGYFDEEHVKKAADLVHSHGLKVKEHNADFLIPEGDMHLRRGLVDAVNIAPHFGVFQTRITLRRAEQMGVSSKAWQNEVYESRKWEKWMLPGGKINPHKDLCVEAGGHYTFNGDTYKKLRDEIRKAWKQDPVKADMMTLVDAVIARYAEHL